MNRTGSVIWSAWVVVLALERTEAAPSLPTVPCWQMWEQEFRSQKPLTADPWRDVTVRVRLTGPDGQQILTEAFWDGGAVWRVRWMPDRPGIWAFETECSDASDAGLHGLRGQFVCGRPVNRTIWDRHGAIRVAGTGWHFVHADGTPFFWLADTAWNGALKSSDEEWDLYLRTRAEQGFNAVQWVATHWRAAPTGDREGRLAFTTSETGRIMVQPEFFQRLDRRARAVAEAGLLNVPVMLWALKPTDPGRYLPLEDAIRLARYMRARWQGWPVAWLLGGDGHYGGTNAPRWRTIGRAVFGDGRSGPVSLHPCGQSWVASEFGGEAWYSFVGYQSGHGDSASTLEWIVRGPPASEWSRGPARPIVDLEPAYEHHLAYQSRTPITPWMTRRAILWGLLTHPPAGFTYGGHGVWGWDDGSGPPVDHPNSGTPLPWPQALRMPGAEQVRHIRAFFESLPFWTLRPAPNLLVEQPGEKDVRRWVAAASTPSGDRIVLYTPIAQPIRLQRTRVNRIVRADWTDPRTGQRHPLQVGAELELRPGADEDALVLIECESSAGVQGLPP